MKNKKVPMLQKQNQHLTCISIAGLGIAPTQSQLALVTPAGAALKRPCPVLKRNLVVRQLSLLFEF